MAYCGVLDGIITIDGIEADTSRLDEGIIVAGNEEYAAEELISEEEKLDFFNEISLRTKEDLLKEIDKQILDAENRQENPTGLSGIALLRRLRAEVEKRTFPNMLEDWWSYEIDANESAVTLSLQHSIGFNINLDDTCDACIDTSFELIKIGTAG